MQRTLTILSLVAILVPVAHAQENTKHWIFFKDKLDADGEVSPPIDVAERALQRRALRATRVQEGVDVPISPHYRARLEELGATVVHESRWLNAVSAYLDLAGKSSIEHLPFVSHVREVASMEAEKTYPVPLVMPVPHSNSDYGPSQLQLEIVNAIPLLERGINGEGVFLGIIDTRFDTVDEEVLFGAPSLRHLNDGRAVWRDFTQVDQQFWGGNQSSRHGVNVTSVAAGYAPGQIIGPAHGATVYAATTEFAPHERNSEEDNLVAALEWMESEGVDVVNISLGYKRFDPGQRSYSEPELDGDTGLTTIAADRAAELGVTVVTSAGNSGADILGPRTIATPADGDSVITVGAVDGNGRRSLFSSFGPTADLRTKPDVAAMGSGVFVQFGHGTYNRANGTSFSSPMVAGIACQLLQVNPSLTPMEILRVLRSTASQSRNADNRLGWGIIDADLAAGRAIDVSNEPAPDALDRLTLETPHPNPALHSTILPIETPRRVHYARIRVYDTLGRIVARPHSGPLQAGRSEIVLDTINLAPGAYYYLLESEGRTRSGTFIVGG